MKDSVFSSLSKSAPDTADHGDKWRINAACRTADPDLFFPNGETGRAVLAQEAEAKAVCGPCPVREQCLNWAMTNGQNTGVWGGMSPKERYNLRRQQARAEQRKNPKPRKVLSPCGTLTAYYRHVKKKEPVDDACRKAATDAQRERREAKRRAIPQCGTRPGYRKHRRNNEPACDACRQANSDADRRLRNTGTTKPRAA